MTWTIGIGKTYNIGRQVDETFPALVAHSGEKLLHLGTRRPPKDKYQKDVFEYQDADLRIGFLTSRLIDGGRTLTNAWTVELRDHMFEPMRGVTITSQIIERTQRKIEEALLSHPLWPSDYGCQETPAAAVRFASLD